MFGVIRLTFDEDAESMSGDEDFFSVARTMPFVARHTGQSLCLCLSTRDNTLDS